MAPQPSAQWLAPVRDALDEPGAPVEVFFRDDDGGWGTGRLLELLDLFASFGLPLDLAVIPADLDADLAAELRSRAARSEGRLGLHQHGYAHLNHEPEGRKYEFGPSRAPAAQRRDIAAGRALLADRLGPIVDPIFTPPWNRCTPATGRCLVELGFAALSREARAEPLAIPGLCELPVRVDWFAKRHGLLLSREEVGGRLADAIRAGGPVGVMFHHAIMDARDMRGARELLSLLAAHARARPCRMGALVARDGPGHGVH